MTTSLRHKCAAIAGGLVVLAGFLLLDGVPKTGGGRNAPTASNLNRAGRGLAGRPYKFTGKYGPNARWGFRMDAMHFEPASESGAAFISRGRGASLRVDGNEVVLFLGSRQSSVVSRQFLKRPWSVVRGPLFAEVDLGDGERTGLPKALLAQPISLTSEFRTQNSEFSPAPSTQHLAPSFVRLSLVGANPHAKVVGLDKLKGISNYLIGNDPKKWRTNVPNYARVMVEDVYPGIDQVFYGKESEARSQESGELEFDFVVHPGADPNAIRLAVAPVYDRRRLGAAAVSPPELAGHRPALQPDPNGDLVLQTDAGEVRLGKPVVYQAATDYGQRTTDDVHSELRTHNSELVGANYVLTASNGVRFELAPYDPRKTLVIDPVLTFSTYLGGSNDDYGGGIAVDSSGNVYVTGQTISTDFPTASPLQSSCSGGCTSNFYDAFVTKLNAAGNALVYSTYLGGSNYELPAGIVVDGSGNAYVTGTTFSTDFPTAHPFQASLRGQACAFVTKLNAAGSALVYSTYLGGGITWSGSSSVDQAHAIAVDGSGNAYVTGQTFSSNFPTVNPFQATNGSDNAFVTKFNAAGSALVYSTYLGGTHQGEVGSGIAVDSAGNAYVTGNTSSTNFPVASPVQASFGGGYGDAFITKFNAAGSALVYSTYLGGSHGDQSSAIAVDSSGNAYVTGLTYSADFPTANPLQAHCGTCTGSSATAFVTKLNAAGNAFIFSTYLGGSTQEYGFGIAADVAGNAYVTGSTDSADFPTVNAIQPALLSTENGFVTEFNPSGSALIYSTYLGGSNNYDRGTGITVDSSGNAYVVGGTNSTDFPLANALQSVNAGGNDVFVAKINPADVPGVGFSPSVVNFGNEVVSVASAAQTVTLMDVGSATLNITAISLTGANAGDFTETNTCAATLTPGTRCTLTVTFTPSATGVRNAAVSVSDDAGGSPQALNLSGNGINPAAVLSPTSLTFANQPVGVASAAQAVALTNSGVGPLTIASINASGDYAQTNNCGTSVAQGASCTVSITLTPTTGGTRFGTVTVTDNATTSPQTVSLTGTGVPPTITLSATSVTFGNQDVGTTSPAQALTVTNNGPGPMLVSGIPVSGDFAETDNCLGTVAALATCTISVTFTPAVNGTRTGTLTINDNAAGNPHVLTLTGTGLGPVASPSPNTLSFPNQQVLTTSAPQAVTLTNSGGATMNLFGILATSPFAETTNCAATLSAGASCAINVTFTPAFIGTTYGSLIISDDAPGSPQTLSLAGASGLTFGAQLVGTTSPAQVVTLKNTGSSPLTISGLATSGDFSATGPCGTLPPGVSCTVPVTFAPKAGGTRSGALLVSDTNPGSPHAVPLTGTGQDFTLTTNQSSASVTAGGTATFNLSVASQGGFSHSLDLSCTDPASLSTCTVSPASVTPTSASPATVTVSVTTTARSQVAPRGPKGPGPIAGHRPALQLWVFALALLALLAVAAVYDRRFARRWVARSLGRPNSAVLGLGTEERPQSFWRTKLCATGLALALLLVLAWGGCGGGSTVRNPGTPAGTYTVTLKALDTQANLSHSTTVTLTVH